MTAIKELKGRTSQPEESGDDDRIMRFDCQNHQRNRKKGKTKADNVLHYCRDTDCQQ